MALVKTSVVANALTATVTGDGFQTSANRPGDYPTKVALVVTVSVTSGTPHVIYKLQGSMDNVTWSDVSLLPNDSETAAASFDKTALGTYSYFVAQNGVRSYPWYRFLSTTVTTSTYTATLYEVT